MAAPERCTSTTTSSSTSGRTVVHLPLCFSVAWVFLFVTSFHVSCLQQPSTSYARWKGPTSTRSTCISRSGIRSGANFERSWDRPPNSVSEPPPDQRRSALFSSSPGASVDGGDGKKGRGGGQRGGGGGRWISKLNPVPRVKKVVASIIAFQSAFRTRFAALPRKAKLMVLAQLLALGLVVGSVGRKVYVNTSQGQAAVAARPVEVPYSTFMDMAEISGKGHLPGKNPAIVIDNVVIGRDRVGFRLSQDEEKHQVALQDKKLGKDDPAVKSISERRVYAMKPLANQDMIDFLRGNGIPFRAASTKGTNAAATVARSAIFLIYVLFLLRMYRSMSGGGGSGDTPGKLALSMDDETIVKFEDIEGIDKAKFEVMEFVDTLRHPQKYAILGARPPTGLLLEGPPGKMAVFIFCFVNCSWW